MRRTITGELEGSARDEKVLTSSATFGVEDLLVRFVRSVEAMRGERATHLADYEDHGEEA